MNISAKVDYEVGLDDEVQEYIYIAHESSPTEAIRLTLKNIEKSGLLRNMVKCDSSLINREEPVIISYGDVNSFKVIMRYLDFYNNTSGEAPSPEKPLVTNKPIAEIFEFESLIFKDLFNIPDFEERMDRLKDALNMVNYYGMPVLLEKLCAIFAFYLAQMTEEEQRKLVSRYM